MTTYRKDPNAALRYGVDWSAWLDAGDSISTSAWIVGAGLTSSLELADADSTSLLLSGGTAGTYYTVTNRITTASGQTDDRSFSIYVVER